MNGLLEGGTAVLFAVVLYALFYAIAGAQLRALLVADESPAYRVFGTLGVLAVAAIVWSFVGALVYWGILIWFRIWLQEPHAWRQQILSLTGWFPFGALFKYGPFPAGGPRAVAIVVGFPLCMFLAAGVVAICHWLRRDERADAPVSGGTMALARELGNTKERT